VEDGEILVCPALRGAARKAKSDCHVSDLYVSSLVGCFRISRGLVFGFGLDGELGELSERVLSPLLPLIRTLFCSVLEFGPVPTSPTPLSLRESGKL